MQKRDKWFDITTRACLAHLPWTLLLHSALRGRGRPPSGFLAASLRSLCGTRVDITPRSFFRYKRMSYIERGVAPLVSQSLLRRGSQKPSGGLPRPLKAKKIDSFFPNIREGYSGAVSRISGLRARLWTFRKSQGGPPIFCSLNPPYSFKRSAGGPRDLRRVHRRVGRVSRDGSGIPQHE